MVGGIMESKRALLLFDAILVKGLSDGIKIFVWRLLSLTKSKNCFASNQFLVDTLEALTGIHRRLIELEEIQAN